MRCVQIYLVKIHWGQRYPSPSAWLGFNSKANSDQISRFKTTTETEPHGSRHILFNRLQNPTASVDRKWHWPEYQCDLLHSHRSKPGSFKRRGQLKSRPPTSSSSTCFKALSFSTSFLYHIRLPICPGFFFGSFRERESFGDRWDLLNPGFQLGSTFMVTAELLELAYQVIISRPSSPHARTHLISKSPWTLSNWATVFKWASSTLKDRFVSAIQNGIVLPHTPHSTSS
jgi:hypothetical protein